MAKPVRDDVLYPELSFKIMAIAFDIHNQLGPGFTEDIYEEATVMDMQGASITVERQKTIDVIYKGELSANIAST